MKGMPNRTSMSVMDFPTDIELIAVSSLEVELSVVSISKSKGFVRLVSFVGDLICLRGLLPDDDTLPLDTAATCSGLASVDTAEESTRY